MKDSITWTKEWIAKQEGRGFTWNHAFDAYRIEHVKEIRAAIEAKASLRAKGSNGEAWRLDVLDLPCLQLPEPELEPWMVETTDEIRDLVIGYFQQGVLPSGKISTIIAKHYRKDKKP